MRLLAITAVILPMACSDVSPAAFQAIDSAGVIIATSDCPLWADGHGWTIDSVPLLSIGEVGGDPRYTLDRVFWPQRLTDGRIVVPNTRGGTLKIYNAAGQYVTELGRQGEGPGEFSFIGHVAADPHDTIRVYDVDLNRITIFAPDGRLARTVRIEMTGYYYGVMVGWFANGAFALTRTSDRALSAYRGDWRDTLDLEWHAADGSVIGRAGVWGGVRRFTTPDGRRFVHPFTPRFMAASSRQEAALGDGYGSHVKVVGPCGQLRQVLRWNMAVSELTDAQYREFAATVAALFPEEELPVYLRALAESPETRRVPQYAALLWDALGNLWVRQYDWLQDSNWIDQGYRGTTGPGTWWVFDAEGRWLGSVPTPDRLDVSVIGQDYVLGVHRDSLDVERVRMYRLTRGS